jgi:putative restriction endonuclease
MASRKNWSHEETIVAFNLYCKIPFEKTCKTTPEVIELAALLNRTPSAVGMKLGNFGRFDPELRQKNISGLKHGSKLDQKVWDEFNGNWDKLTYESELLLERFRREKGQETIEADGVEDIPLPIGADIRQEATIRVNQGFFRKAVLAAHNLKCCITGLNLPQLLVASHIKSWKASDAATERTNPRNGLCLNALHDKAFDRGLMTIDTSFKIVFSKELYEAYPENIIKMFFRDFDGHKIIMPNRFIPQKDFIEWHNEFVFKGG